MYSIFQAIEFGVISKEKVRKDLLNNGNISFVPNLVRELNTPYKSWKDGLVLGIDVNTQISINDEIFVENNGCWFTAKIVNLQQENKDLESVSSGKTGVKLSKKLPKGKIYVKHI